MKPWGGALVTVWAIVVFVSCAVFAACAWFEDARVGVGAVERADGYAPMAFVEFPVVPQDPASAGLTPRGEALLAKVLEWEAHECAVAPAPEPVPPPPEPEPSPIDNLSEVVITVLMLYLGYDKRLALARGAGAAGRLFRRRPKPPVDQGDQPG